MNVQRNGFIGTCKRLFGGNRNERALLTTFWANDYKRGQDYDIEGRAYRITRYVRAADGRFFEVWGYEVQAKTTLVARGVAA
jgi:hypothetical protein